MRAWAKLVLGAAAFAPAVSAVLLGAHLAFRLIAFDLETGGALLADPLRAIEDGPFDATELVLLGVAAVTIALFELALAAVFALHAARDPRPSRTGILLWIVAFIFAGPVALPLYFLRYMARDPVTKVELPDIP